MGKINNVWNHYFRNRERFADLFNGTFFQGVRHIKAENLTDASEVYEESEAEKTDASERTERLERIRDIKMKLNDSELLYFLAVENQNQVDYTMPFRCMQYDTMEYGRQLNELRTKNNAENSYQSWTERTCGIKKTDLIMPVYTLCVYHGEEPWDGPRSLKDMMSFSNEDASMKEFFSDYPLRLLCLNEKEDFSVFQTEIRQLFQAMKYRKNKKKLQELMKTDPQYQHMDVDTLEVLSVVLNAPELWENRELYLNRKTEKEEVNMCQALEEWLADERMAGMEAGMLSTLNSLVAQGLLRLEDAAKQAGMSEEEFSAKIAELSLDAPMKKK